MFEVERRRGLAVRARHRKRCQRGCGLAVDGGGRSARLAWDIVHDEHGNLTIQLTGQVGEACLIGHDGDGAAAGGVGSKGGAVDVSAGEGKENTASRNSPIVLGDAGDLRVERSPRLGENAGVKYACQLVQADGCHGAHWVSSLYIPFSSMRSPLLAELSSLWYHGY